MAIELSVPRAREIDRELARATGEGLPEGTVHARVRLTNPMDVAMVREGYETPDRIRSIEVDALVDTGAVQCVIPPSLVERLGLACVGVEVARFADGREAEVPVTEPLTFELMDFGRRTSEECFVFGDDVFIGQTVLEKTDMFVDCRARRLVPNPDHPNRAVFRM